jgi:hypothetical protein
MRRIRTEIEIEGSAEDVWSVLADTESYQAWNPFIREIEGGWSSRERLNVRMTPPDGRSMRFRPTVLRAEESREFCWIGHLGLPGLLDAEHRFAIEPLEEGRVRFVQEEEFRGILAPLLMRGKTKENTEKGFTLMNEALKRRVEEA